MQCKTSIADFRKKKHIVTKIEHTHYAFKKIDDKQLKFFTILKKNKLANLCVEFFKQL